MPTISKQKANGQTKEIVKPELAWDLVSGMQVLMYGSGGTGKTRLWSTFPGRICAFICSGGKRPTELLSIDTKANREKIDPYVIHDSSQILDVLENAEDNDIQTIVLDQVTNLQSLLLKEHLGLLDIPAVRNWGMATDADWGNVNQKTIEICRELLNFAGNVVIVGHERVHAGREDVSGDTNIIHPHLSVAATPGVAKWLEGAVSYAMQTYIRQKMRTIVVKRIPADLKKGTKEKVITRQERDGKAVEYCLRTGVHEDFYVKFRSSVEKDGKMPECIVNPNYEKIKQLLD